MTMIAEGSSSSQTPVPRGGSPLASERDLLAERRARRATEFGESALVRRAETAEATVKTLEGLLASLQRRLAEAEEDGRRTAELAERLEQVESALAAIRESHRRMAGTVSELKGVAMRLRVAVEAEPPPEPLRPRSDEMADALAAAVERLRARAQASVVSQPDATLGAPPVAREPHKHSMSLIGRWRMRRKQRRGR